MVRRRTDNSAAANTEIIETNEPISTQATTINSLPAEPVLVKREYRLKTNPKRFFYPKEWSRFLSVVENENHKFWFELLLHTGARYNEAAHIEVRDIDFERELVFIRKPKGGKGRERTFQISTYFKNRIQTFIKRNELGKLDTLHDKSKTKFPSIQYLDRTLKEYVQKAGINDPLDFSCHNLRKTLENWLIAININHLSVVAHVGHTLDVASMHYVAASIFTAEDKVLIRAILDNLLNK